jgi:exopolyphosphatase/guanosine-5'-triphosphate,3'-diphosphate pyrophosphatase
MSTPSLFAAIDLGSNSFRLEIAQLDHGLLRRTEYLKETVRQGNGLDTERRLSQAAMQRGWDCLARFGERLHGFDASAVRAVATQTLREARNRDEFIIKAQGLLGFPIDVIAGREEARLIYLGVAHALPLSDERRLVVDIGGRSTEMILGQRLKPRQVESFPVGSVAWSLRYFPEGQFAPAAFKAAEIAAKAVLEEGLDTFEASNWETAYGSSGTAGAVADALVANGWPAGGISLEALDWLLERLVKAKSADRLMLAGLKEDRRMVIGGGVSVLRAVFSLLGIKHMRVAEGALRHGVLHELLDLPDKMGRRELTVTQLSEKFHIDKAQATRVAEAAGTLFGMLELGSAPGVALACSEVRWAARLHELGLPISHSEHHKHGAYILDNSDAPGFTQQQIHRLSRLVLGQRGKLRKLEADFADALFMRQLLALRLAVILCHARRAPQLQGLLLRMESGARPRITLTAQAGWASAFPQSAHLLLEEAQAWAKAPCPPCPLVLSGF